MKILHCCLSCFYIDGYSYQENLLPKMNLAHGHDVEIIASTEIFGKEGTIEYTQPSEYYTENGIKITRVPYRKGIPRMVAHKLRSYKGVYELICNFNPDIIMFHGLPAYELLNIAKYKKKNPNVKLYVDSHEDHNNSARNFISKYVLHRLFYRHIIGKSLPYINRVFYITEETKDFICNEYKIPEGLTEFYPLGGELILEDQRDSFRKDIRKNLGVDDNTLLVMHSGKLDKLKRTDILVEGINRIQSNKILLLIAGTIPPENKELWDVIQRSDKVRWIGWLDAEDMKKYLCASDIYAQPGSQSATAQNAICCGKPVMLYPHKSYKVLCDNNVIWVENSNDVYESLCKLLDESLSISKLSQASVKLAENVLDYDVLAKKIEK